MGTRANGWTEFIAEVAPEDAPLIGQKKHVPYYIAGTLKDAELSEAARRQKGLSAEQSAIGKARSGSHIASLGPVLFLDDDGDVFAREAPTAGVRRSCIGLQLTFLMGS